MRKLAGFEFPGTDPTITGYQAVVELDAPDEARARLAANVARPRRVESPGAHLHGGVRRTAARSGCADHASRGRSVDPARERHRRQDPVDDDGDALDRQRAASDDLPNGPCPSRRRRRARPLALRRSRLEPRPRRRREPRLEARCRGAGRAIISSIRTPPSAIPSPRACSRTPARRSRSCVPIRSPARSAPS